MVGEPVFAVIMVTIGILFVIEQLVTAIWGPGAKNLGDPWGVETVDAGGVVLAVADLWTIGLTAAVLAAFFVFFRFSRYGLAMRADRPRTRRRRWPRASASTASSRLSWAIAGIVAALAGVTLVCRRRGVDPTSASSPSPRSRR